MICPTCATNSGEPCLTLFEANLSEHRPDFLTQPAVPPIAAPTFDVFNIFVQDMYVYRVTSIPRHMC